MNHLWRLVTLLALCVFALPAQGLASSIAWELSGTIISSSGGPGAIKLEEQGLVVGTPISFRLLISDTAIDLCPEDGRALYLPQVIGTAFVPGTYYTGSGAGLEANATSGGCVGTIPNNDFTFYVMRMLQWNAPFGNATFLWSAAADPDLYPFAIPPFVTLYLTYAGLGQPDLVAGLSTVREGTLPSVPEPGSLVLLGTGIAAALGRWRRRRPYGT